MGSRPTMLGERQSLHSSTSIWRPAALQACSSCRKLRDAQVQEVGDGNINFVYIVEGPKGGLVVKQGLPYIRIAPDWPLTQVCTSSWCSSGSSLRSLHSSCHGTLISPTLFSH